MLLASLIGSAVGAAIGIVAGVTLDSALLAWIAAGAFPIVALVLAGIREYGFLVKIGGYALLGWGLCFVLEPTISQSAASHALRMSSDPLAGKGWYIACHTVSWILVSVGMAFRTPKAPNQALDQSRDLV
jgi:hypothetical protein